MKPVDPKTKTQVSNDPTSTAKTVQLGLSEKNPMTGQVLGTYQILDVLGKGGMGVVFRAKDTTLDRTVAVKVLAPELSGDEAYVERFLREAKSAAKLDHPNVVQVYAAGRTQALCWMAMQYAKGVPLSTHLRRGRKFSVQESLQVVRQVAQALGAAHEAGIVHRDIKPSNIMLDEAGRALVMDFGLSRGIATGERITRTGTYLGTPEYSSPEQCETNDLDGRSDIYSLGVVFYEMLTGRVPHVAETPLALFRKIAEERPTPVTAINKQVPPSVQALLDRMLAKDRARRYATAAELVRDIDRVLEGRPPVASPAPRKRLWIAPAAAAALLAVGIAVWRWPSSTPPQPAPPTNGGGSVVVPKTLGSKVVVLDFKDLKGDKETAWMEVGLPELLLGQLDALLQGQVIPREELLETMGRVVGKKVNADQGGARMALGKELSDVVASVEGRLVVIGTYAVNRQEIQVTATVYERKAGAELVRLQTCTERGSVDDLFGLVDKLAESVASSAARAMAPAASDTPQVSPTAFAPELATGGDNEGLFKNNTQDLGHPVSLALKKAGDKLALGSRSERLRGLFAEVRRGGKQEEKVGAMEPPASPNLEGTDGGEESSRRAQRGQHGEPGAVDAQQAYASATEKLARMKRFFENLRACEEMDLSQQKALRNDQAFLESLCDEECADTLKQKYQSWCESNQTPKQEAEPAR